MLLSRSFVKKYIQISTITIVITIVCMTAYFVYEMDRRFKMDLMNVEASYIASRTEELKKAVMKMEYYLKADQSLLETMPKQIVMKSVNFIADKLENGFLMTADVTRQDQMDRLTSSFRGNSLFVYGADGDLLYSHIPTHKKCAFTYHDDLVGVGQFKEMKGALTSKQNVYYESVLDDNCFDLKPNRMLTYLKRDNASGIIIGSSILTNWNRIQWGQRRLNVFKRMNRSQNLTEKEKIHVYSVLNLDDETAFAQVAVHPDETQIGTVLNTRAGDGFYEKVLNGLKKEGQVFVTHWMNESKDVKVPFLSYYALNREAGVILSSSMPLTGVDMFMRAQEKRLINERNRIIRWIGGLGFIFILLVLFLNLWVGKQMEKEVGLFSAFFKDLAFTHKRIDMSEIKSTEFERLGAYANDMLQEMFDKQELINSLNEGLEMKVVEKTRELNQLNRELEDRVELEVNLNRQKDKLLHEKTRYAAMGDLLINISHHWRQPLNNIGLILESLNSESASNNNSIQQAMGEFRKLSESLSEIQEIYGNIDQDKQFDLKLMIDECLDEMSESIVSFDIQVADHLLINGSVDRFKDVVRNLMQNAHEAIVDNHIEDGKIKIIAEPLAGQLKLSVEDNGGGIAPDKFEKIFAPYFTSKSMRFGKGLGLYKAKVIIENNFNGKIFAMNTRNGAKFIIDIPNGSC